MNLNSILFLPFLKWREREKKGEKRTKEKTCHIELHEFFLFECLEHVCGDALECVVAQHETAQHELPESAQRTHTQRVEVVVCGWSGVSMV